MQNINLTKVLLLLLGILGIAIAILFIGGDLQLNTAYWVKEGYINDIYGRWTVILSILIIGIVGVGLELKNKNISGFIGPAFAIAAMVTYSFSIAIFGFTFFFLEDSLAFALTTVLIVSGLASFIEIGRAGRQGASKTLISRINIYSALFVILATFASCGLPASGHPAIPIAILTGPLAIIAAIIWILLVTRFSRNRGERYKSTQTLA